MISLCRKDQTVLQQNREEKVASQRTVERKRERARKKPLLSWSGACTSFHGTKCSTEAA
jgi:hypothetical protein